MSHEVRFERLFDATAEEVFDAFSQQDGQRAMFDNGAPGWIVESECDFRVGGEWRVATGPSRRELYRFVHVFQAIDRPRSVAFVVTESEPAGASFDSNTDITFEEQNGKTRLVFVQRFPTAELRDAHEQGLPAAFGRLDRVVRSESRPA